MNKGGIGGTIFMIGQLADTVSRMAIAWNVLGQVCWGEANYENKRVSYNIQYFYPLQARRPPPLRWGMNCICSLNVHMTYA